MTYDVIHVHSLLRPHPLRHPIHALRLARTRRRLRRDVRESFRRALCGHAPRFVILPPSPPLAEELARRLEHEVVHGDGADPHWETP